MSLIQHTFFPRRMFDMDTWLPTPLSGLSPLATTLAPSTLDVFDPFDELDRMMSRNLRWIDRPSSFLPALAPTVPQKYRITVDCAGFSPESIKTEIKEQKGEHILRVHGEEESGKKGGDDYSRKELRKSFTLPKNVEHDKMASFMAPGGRFVIEFPMKETKAVPSVSLLPQIVDKEGGGKELKLDLPLPENVDPNKVQVSIKDRDLIIRCEDRTETPDLISTIHIYNRTTLPENTDFNALKCVAEGNKLHITAPVNLQLTGTQRNIPLEVKGSQQQQISGSQQQQMQQQKQPQMSR